MLSKINLKYITLSALLISSIVAKKAKIYNKCLKPGQFVLTCKYLLLISKILKK